MAIEIVGFPINSMVIFDRFLYVYQRVHENMSPLWSEMDRSTLSAEPMPLCE